MTRKVTNHTIRLLNINNIKNININTTMNGNFLVRLFAMVAVFALVCESKPLEELFNALVKKQADVKNAQLLKFISKAVPQGIDAPNPKIAEYETFKSDKSANFITDGTGNVHFRQYRRLRLADVFQRRGRNGI